ncbi:TPA: hypothetical protein U2L31_000149 [Burkholderia contaminans]|nr:hypothetical protein [Burkholderia contaminans]
MAEKKNGRGALNAHRPQANIVQSDSIRTADEVQLPAGFVWLPDDCLDHLRAIFNRAIEYGVPEFLSHVEIEPQDDAPFDDCAVISCEISGFPLRFYICGWQPIARVDANVWMRHLAAICDDTFAIEDVAASLHTVRGAQELAKHYRIDTRDDLMKADRVISDNAWDMRDYLNDPFNWTEPIPASAAIECVVPAKWMQKGQA